MNMDEIHFGIACRSALACSCVNPFSKVTVKDCSSPAASMRKEGTNSSRVDGSFRDENWFRTVSRAVISLRSSK